VAPGLRPSLVFGERTSGILRSKTSAPAVAAE